MRSLIKNLRVFPKLVIPIALTTAVTIAIVWNGTESLDQLGRMTHDITERQVPSIIGAINARNLLNEAAVSAQNLIFEAAQDGVDPNETQFSKLLAAADAELRSLDMNASFGERPFTERARNAIAKYGRVEHQVFDLSRRRQNAEAFAIAGQDGRAALDAARTTIEQVAEVKQAQLAALTAAADRILRPDDFAPNSCRGRWRILLARPVMGDLNLPDRPASDRDGGRDPPHC